MIFGAHVIIHSRNPTADRAFLRDVLGFTGVDAGGGWLILALPPAEVAVHPAQTDGLHQLYLMCDDLHGEIANLYLRGVQCSRIHKETWGNITTIELPGGGLLGLYQPLHATAIPPAPVLSNRSSERSS
jgi:hypothetical protein